MPSIKLVFCLISQDELHRLGIKFMAVFVCPECHDNMVFFIRVFPCGGNVGGFLESAKVPLGEALFSWVSLGGK